MLYLKQSTAVDVMLGPFVDDTDGKTTEEALTLSQADLQLSKNGGAAAQKNDATSATHRYGGNYMVDLNTTDTNTLGHLRLMCKESGALPVVADFMVVTANWYDTMCSTDQLDVNVTNVAGTAQTANDNGADINAILVDTNALNDTKIPDTISLAAINAQVDTALSDYDPPTKAELDSAFTEIKGGTWAAGTDTLEHIRNKQTDIETDTQDLQTQVGVAGAGLTALNDPTAAAVADAVWDEAKAGHVGAGSFGEEVQAHSLSSEISALNDPTAASIADAVWDEDESGHTTADSFGQWLRQLKFVTVNQMEVTEATGNTVIKLDNDTDNYCSVAAAFASAAGVTTRKRLE